MESYNSWVDENPKYRHIATRMSKKIMDRYTDHDMHFEVYYVFLPSQPMDIHIYANEEDKSELPCSAPVKVLFPPRV